MKELVALILAGGSGTRFFPFVEDKLLFRMLGKPFISLAPVMSLPKQVNKVVIVANARNKEWFENHPLSASQTVLLQPESNGMADAILLAEKEITDCRLLILIADDFFDPSLLGKIVDQGEKGDTFGVIPGWKTQTYFPGGYLTLSEKKVSGIVEKPGAGNEPSAYVNISGHYLAQSSLLLQALKLQNRTTDDIYEAALTELMSTQEFSFVPYDGDFRSLKYPWHVLSVMDLLLSQMKESRGENVVIKDHVVIEGPVFLGNNVKIMEFTKIVGPVYIGDNTIVGNNNCIRNSMIGSNCITGFNTDITRSYIGNSCWFHSNYIGDSVLEENVSMGSGTVLANLRLDEKEITSSVKGNRVITGRTKLGSMIGSNVRIGVNASIMPGVKIGSGSFVGAGVIVNHDIPPESFCHVQTELVVLPNTKKADPHMRDSFKLKL